MAWRKFQHAAECFHLPCAAQTADGGNNLLRKRSASFLSLNSGLQAGSVGLLVYTARH
jgi:hypothetical protein